MCDGIQFREFLHDEEDAFSHFLCEQSQFDEVLVLVAVADDETVGVHVGGEHRVEFRFGACLESEVIFFSVADDFLHDGSHLVHLDGIDDEVLRLVVICLRCFVEAVRCLFDSVVKDVRESEEHGCGDVS